MLHAPMLSILGHSTVEQPVALAPERCSILTGQVLLANIRFLKILVWDNKPSSLGFARVADEEKGF
jgi:hypothetical protein